MSQFGTMGLGVLRTTAILLLSVSTSLLFAANTSTTHKHYKSLQPTDGGRTYQLNTFALGPDGNLWLCCTDVSPANGDYSPEFGGAGILLIKQPTGETVKTIPLEFAPQAINFANDGSIYLAGSGKVAHLNIDGTVNKLIKAPNLLDEAEMKQKLEALGQKMVERVTKSYGEQIERLDKQIAELEESRKEIDETDERALKRADLRIETMKRSRQSYERNLETLTESYKRSYSPEQLAQRVKRDTGIAVNKQDVFVAVPSVEGQGYSIYRMNRDLEEAVLVKDTVGGCCGQLDIQTDGADLLVAENTSFRVGRYDRDGKEVAAFGERKKDGNDGWGSCCNPMNIRCLENGEILTAESSVGDIKRYSKAGDYLGKIGTAHITGGCKHVAVHFDAKRNWYYMMNQGGGDIAILAPNEEVGETPEEKLSQEARAGLGKKLVGAWKIETPKAAAKTTERVAPATLLAISIASNQYPYLHFHHDGHVSLQPVTSSDENTPANLAVRAAPSMEWECVRQTDDTLEVALISNGVRNYHAKIKFTDDENAEIAIGYADSSLPTRAASKYARVAGECCEDGKPCKECAGKCDLDKQAAANE